MKYLRIAFWLGVLAFIAGISIAIHIIQLSQSADVITANAQAEEAMRMAVLSVFCFVVCGVLLSVDAIKHLKGSLFKQSSLQQALAVLAIVVFNLLAGYVYFAVYRYRDNRS